MEGIGDQMNLIGLCTYGGYIEQTILLMTCVKVFRVRIFTGLSANLERNQSSRQGIEQAGTGIRRRHQFHFITEGIPTCYKSQWLVEDCR